MNIPINFWSDFQEQGFWSRARNNCLSGGFGNGKSFVGCLRQFTYLATFPKYRSLIAREVFKDLRETTMKTFFKICPESFIYSHDVQGGVTTLKNGSTVLWKHLDEFDEKSLRGLEINSALIDQAEESKEAIFLVLDSRIGRWDQAEVPEHLLRAHKEATGKDWPRNEKTGKPRVHNFFDILVNPDDVFHWVYRRFHPESLERNPDYFFIEAETDPSMNDPNTIKEMLNRDEEWVNKYFRGKWGASPAQIHFVNSMSIIDPDKTPGFNEFLSEVLRKGALFRAMDHGDTSPTCCLWVAAYKGVYIFYREYYTPNQLISYHRESIHALSNQIIPGSNGDFEIYSGDYADPSIFRKEGQKEGRFWTVADEYLTSDLAAPPIVWMPADNNEMATRNRINELLKPTSRFRHPLTGQSPAPGIYFLKRTRDYPYGCHNAILQLSSQRRELIGSENGRSVYSDARDMSIPDHAYDPTRYFIAMHGAEPRKAKRAPGKNTFAYYNSLLNRTRLGPNR